MEYALHDQSGFPVDPAVTVELPDDLVPIPPGYCTMLRPWIAPGRDGAGVLMLWVPEGSKDPLNDPSVPVTIRSTTITAKQLIAAGLKRGLMPRETLQARLVDYLRLTISSHRQ